jgi:hypothetical protein
MCTDLGPDLQMRCGTAVLPALLGAMDDFQNPRVQAHASAAVVNFSEGCDSDIMRPHLDTLISEYGQDRLSGTQLGSGHSW